MTVPPYPVTGLAHRRRAGRAARRPRPRGARRRRPPLDPTFPVDDAVVGLRPTFSWEAAAAVPGRYEVYVELPGGPVEVAEVGGTTLTATATVALPDDARLRWFVRAAGGPGVAARHGPRQPPAHPGGHPAGGAGDHRLAARDHPQLRAALRLERRPRLVALVDPQRRPGRRCSRAPSRAASGPGGAGPLPDGSYQFRVAQRNLVGVEGPPAAVGFSVDTAAPGRADPAPLHGRGRTRATPPPTRGPASSGAPPSPGASCGASGAVDPGAGERRGRRGRRRRRLARGLVRLRGAPDRPRGQRRAARHRRLRRAAAAGRRGCACRCGTPGRLTPSVGRDGAAPCARRCAGPPGPRAPAIYNVQVFRVADGAKLRKVLSAFPKRQRFVVPAPEVPRARRLLRLAGVAVPRAGGPCRARSASATSACARGELTAPRSTGEDWPNGEFAENCEKLSSANRIGGIIVVARSSSARRWPLLVAAVAGLLLAVAPSALGAAVRAGRQLEPLGRDRRRRRDLLLGCLAARPGLQDRPVRGRAERRSSPSGWARGRS